MNLKWTALAAMALLTPCVFAQQSYGWVRQTAFAEFWAGWREIDVYHNNHSEPLYNLTYTKPNLPRIAQNRVWGSAYTGCPWTAPFATLFDSPFNVQWIIPDHVEVYDERSGTSGPAPNPLTLNPGYAIHLEYNYYHSQGYESWRWIQPPRGIEVEGTPPDPMDEGPHRRDRDVESQWRARIIIRPF
ncbi:MAG: hypothetical protein Fur0036_12880 [Fimbriimonadaceae bacterium]